MEPITSTQPVTGDELIDALGRPTRVVAATDVMTDRPCFEVELSDGTTIVADAEHQCLTETRAARKSRWVQSVTSLGATPRRTTSPSALR